ncbi:MAG TPA: hypothetical protein VNF07_07850 [Acidimicrobiales bacterium]|nr:hypothetical protein [Acidimicrobiales bacterium]
MLALGLGALILLAAAAAALLAVVHHVATGNSDGATVVLEGQAVANGHPLLQGWSLSLDSFWTVDVPFYAVAVALFGTTGTLMTAVPAAIAALVVVLAVALALDGGRGFAAATGAVSAAAFLIFPSRAMALFFVQGPLHVGSLLWCLIAFALVERDRLGARWALAVLFLALGLLGDLQTLLLGLIPMVFAGLVLGHLRQSFREVKGLLLAPLAAGVLAVVIREVARAFGTFVVPRANTFASAHQFLRNVAHLPGYFAALVGVVGGPFTPSGVPLPLRLLHLLALALVLGGPVVTGVSYLQALRHSHRRAVELPPGAVLDLLLLGGFGMGVATFLVLPIITSDAYARYLVPAVVCGAILGGRVVARTVAGLSGKALRVGLVGVGLLVVTLASSFGLELRGPATSQPAASLADFLAAHGLRQGIGDYWSASVITVVSKDAVTVRPVIEEAGHRLVRYDKQSAAGWYGPRSHFNFLIFNARAVWNGVSGTPAVSTFGQPTRVYADGTYRIYVWAKPFTLSTKGSTGP